MFMNPSQSVYFCNIMYKRIDHFSLQVSDVEKSVAFYKTLGFEQLNRPAFDFKGAWFAIGNKQQLHLMEGLTTAVNSGRRKTHFAVSVHDMEAFEQHLKKQTIHYQPPKQRPDGVVQIFLKDPDGYYWEFNEVDY